MALNTNQKKEAQKHTDQEIRKIPGKNVALKMLTALENLIAQGIVNQEKLTAQEAILEKDLQMALILIGATQTEVDLEEEVQVEQELNKDLTQQISLVKLSAYYSSVTQPRLADFTDFIYLYKVPRVDL